MIRALVSLFVVAAVAAAQAPPTPSVETIAGESSNETWSAEESLAYARLQELAYELRHGQSHSAGWNPAFQEYDSIWVGHDSANDRSLICQEIPRPPQRPGLLYVMPKQDLANGKRLFCLRSDGLIAWTDNAKERTAPVDLSNFPRTPQIERDGNLWQPGSTVPTVSRTVSLVNERGKPLAMTMLCCEPAWPQFVITQALAAGRCRTTFEGDATITGVLATGLGFAIQVGQARYWIEPEFVTTRGRSLRITLPSRWLARMQLGPNEAAAIATLKNISSAQAQCQASGVIDTDQDGRGEFGMFGELSGKFAIRGKNQTIQPPVLSAAFGLVKGGIVTRSGYHFMMLLAGKDGRPIHELASGGANKLPLVADLAETTWCCYAWPTEAGQSGQRAFAINQLGNVVASANTNRRYDGIAARPKPGAAFVAQKGDLRAQLAHNQQGSDRQTWVVVH